MRRCIVVICAALFAASRWTPSAAAAPVENPDNGHWYEIVTSDTNAANYWQDIEQKASLALAHLATINDAKEQDWIYETFVSKSNRNYWIGLNDLLNEGSLVWASGESSSYTNWDDAWHNTAGRDYAYIRQSDGQWDMGGPNDYGLGITERAMTATPEPVSSLLFLLGGAVFAVGRRDKRQRLDLEVSDPIP